MILVFEGAEARIFKSSFLGKKCLVKQRISKKYRRKELDERIKKQRTKQEVLLLHKAKILGIRTPIIYDVDLKNFQIVMEFIKGNQLKKVLSKNLFLLSRIGKIVGLMHKNNIIHGDLTSSNIFVEGKKIVFLDFGLGFQSASFEDKAIDLIGFKKSFYATHSRHLKHWNKILKAYEKETGYSQIFIKIKEIEQRARYS